MPDQRNVAIGLMRGQRYAEALSIFIRLMGASPNDWSLYYMAGQCSRFSDRLPVAVQYLSKAASLKPDEPQLLLALGIARQLTGDYEQAIEALEHALRLDPQLVAAYNSLGLTHSKAGDLRNALHWYERAAEAIVTAATEEVHKDREKCFREEIIDGEKTLVVLPYVLEKTHEVLRSDPIYAIVKNNIGACLIELGKFDAAREQLLESIEFIPEGYDYPDPREHLESIG